MKLEEERLKKEEADRKNNNKVEEELLKNDYTYDINGNILFVKKIQRFVEVYPKASQYAVNEAVARDPVPNPVSAELH
jgi:hypothetical protein